MDRSASRWLWIGLVSMGPMLVACDQAKVETTVQQSGSTSVTSKGASSASAGSQGEGEAGEASPIKTPTDPARWEEEEEQSGVDPVHEAQNVINAERAKSGLAPLNINKLLNQAAQGHATFIAENFSLYTEQGLSIYLQPADAEGTLGETPIDRLNNIGYTGVYSAELIAFKHTPTAAVHSWLETLYQRLKVLDPDLSEMGLGWSTAGDYTLHIVELGRHE